MDTRRLIVIAFLARFIFASIYDIYVSKTDRYILLPDEQYYSMKGRYIALLLNGYDKEEITEDMLPKDEVSRKIFLDTLRNEEQWLPTSYSETDIYAYILGLIYFIFGYFPLAARAFNITLSISSAYLMFKVAKRNFGELPANLFLLAALFLPTQFGYSITLSRDFLRMFIICFILWRLYG